VVLLIAFSAVVGIFLSTAGGIALGIGFLHSALALYRTDSDAEAMKTSGYSILYLSLLFAFLLADHYARLFLRAFVL
jgi:protoheme IX farnesyltransferase